MINQIPNHLISATVRISGPEVRPGRFSRITFRPEGGDEGVNEGGEGGSSGGAGDNKGDDGKIEFTPSQQTFLEKRINEAYRKGAEKTEGKLNGRITELSNALEALKNAKPEAGKKPEGEGEKTYSQAEVKKLIEEALKEPTEKLTAAETKAKALLSKDRESAIVAAAGKANVAGDYREFAILVDRFVIHDDEGKLMVTEDGNTPKLNSKGDPVSVDEFVKAYVDARPHLKKGTGIAGAGSSTAGSGGTGAAKGGAPKNALEANAMLAKVFGGQK